MRSVHESESVSLNHDSRQSESGYEPCVKKRNVDVCMTDVTVLDENGFILVDDDFVCDISSTCQTDVPDQDENTIQLQQSCNTGLDDCETESDSDDSSSDSDSSDTDSETCSSDIESTDPDLNDFVLDGRRIVNLCQLQKLVSIVTTHALKCTKAFVLTQNGKEAIVLIGETRRIGLASIQRVRCNGCGEVFDVEMDLKMKDPDGNLRYGVNMAAIWGSISAGIGNDKLGEVLSTMGMPMISSHTFSKTEQKIGKWWAKILEDDMLKAGEEEKDFAIKEGSIDREGVPWIRVYADCGWSKRAHKHSYNALGGAGIIIGAKTKKVLYMGVRIKYCRICAIDEGKDTKREHICYKNWDGSSRAMESDIILEGFREAEGKYGIRYLELVGDGDSSVLPTLISQGPSWCRNIKKIECANHCCKCLRGNLEKLVDKHPEYKGRGKLTKNQRVRIVSSMRCSIMIHSHNTNFSDKVSIQQNSTKLKNEILNIPNHVFGIHRDCSERFCKVKQQQNQECKGIKASSGGGDGQIKLKENNQSKNIKGFSSGGGDCREVSANVSHQHGQTASSFTVGCGCKNLDSGMNENVKDCGSHSVDVDSGLERVNEGEFLGELFKQQYEYYMEGMSEEELESARACNGEKVSIDEKLMVDVKQIMRMYAAKADRLIYNETTNIAECWMYVKCKFDGAKSVNRMQRGSWTTRCTGACLRFQNGADWSPKVWERVTGEKPSAAFIRLYQQRCDSNKSGAKYRQSKKGKLRRRQWKLGQSKVSDQGKSEYGKNCRTLEPDIDSDTLMTAMGEFYKSKVKVSENIRLSVELETQDQDSDKWMEERKVRITGSTAHAAVAHRSKTLYAKKIERHLYGKHVDNEHTRYGKESESVSIKRYVSYMNNLGKTVSVSKSGLNIHPKLPYLAASPDGLVNENSSSLGVLEIKNLSVCRNLTIQDAFIKSKDFPLSKDKKGNFNLKTRHTHYTQCQTLLEVLDREWIDYALFTEVDLYVERISRNRQWWKKNLSKLEKFYFHAILPELAHPRYKKGNIREPPNTEHLSDSERSFFGLEPVTQ